MSLIIRVLIVNGSCFNVRGSRLMVRPGPGPSATIFGIFIRFFLSFWELEGARRAPFIIDS